MIIYIYTLSYYRSLSYCCFYHIAVDWKKTTRTRSIRKSRMGRLEQSWMGTLALESVAICMGISYTHQLFFLKGYLRVAMF